MLDRSIAPDFVTTKHVDFQSPEKIQLAGGLPVFLFNGGKQAVTRIEIVFPAGRWFEPSPGIAHFTAKVLAEGSKSFNTRQIAEILDINGAHLETVSGFDYATITLHCLSDKLDTVLPVLIDILNYPTFPVNELEKQKDIYKQNLAINLEKNGYVSGKLIREKLFGLNNPYGRDLGIDEIQQLTAEELNNNYLNNYIQPKVFIAGLLNKDQEDILFNSLEQIEFRNINKVNNNYHKLDVSERVLIDKVQSIQTSVRLAAHSVNRENPDYFNLLIFNQIFGGYFGSRLMKNIREEKGLTYGIHSAVHTLRNGSYFSVNAEVNKQNRELVIDEIYKEREAISISLIPQNEFKAAINNFIGSIQSEMSTIFAHADKFKVIELNGLDTNHNQKLIEFAAGITSTQLNDFINRYIKTLRFQEVIVG